MDVKRDGLEVVSVSRSGVVCGPVCSASSE